MTTADSKANQAISNSAPSSGGAVTKGPAPATVAETMTTAIASTAAEAGPTPARMASHTSSRMGTSSSARAAIAMPGGSDRATSTDKALPASNSRLRALRPGPKARRRPGRLRVRSGTPATNRPRVSPAHQASAAEGNCSGLMRPPIASQATPLAALKTVAPRLPAPSSISRSRLCSSRRLSLARVNQRAAIQGPPTLPAAMAAASQAGRSAQSWMASAPTHRPGARPGPQRTSTATATPIAGQNGLT